MKNMLAKLGALDVFLCADIADVSTASDVYIPVPVTGILKKVYCSISGAITLADTIITFANPTGDMTDTLTVAYAASAAGSTFSKVITNQANRKFVAGQRIKIACGGQSTDTALGKVVLVFERTRV